MISKQAEGKGILAKFLEQGIKIFLKNECRRIGEININIVSSSIEILQGIIQKVYIIAKDINYKDLLFDEIELEAKGIKIKFGINNKELNFRNNFIIKFKILLSEKSLMSILSSNNWDWIGDKISKELFSQSKLENIEINNDELFINTSKGNKVLKQENIVLIKTERGNLYLENKYYNKSIKIPMEDKVYIQDAIIKDNKIIISAKSSINFN